MVRTACLCAWVAKELLSTKEGLGYNLKKGKAAFAPHKTSFVKNNGRFCNRCKQVRHIEHYCKNKNKDSNVSLIQFDSCYLLTKGANGVKAKFVRTLIVGSKKKAIWVPFQTHCECP